MSEKNIEIRNYPPVIVAETEVAGERDKAISGGFRTIAGYIFGNNLSSQKVAMTAPVTQQPSEKIAMTAPVTQRGNGTSWQHLQHVGSTSASVSHLEPQIFTS